MIARPIALATEPDEYLGETRKTKYVIRLISD